MAFAETLAENNYFPTDYLIESNTPIDTQYFFDSTWQALPEYLIPWHWMSSSNQSFPTNSSSSQTPSLPTPTSEHYFHDEMAGGWMDDPSFGTTQLSPISSKNQQSAGFSFPTSQTTTTKEDTQSSIRNRDNDQESLEPFTTSDFTRYQSTPEPPKRRKAGKQSVNRRLLCEKRNCRETRTELDDAKSEQQMKVRERNRRAAAKCRDRKKDQANELTSRMEELQDRHRLLSSCYSDLQQEVSQLKFEILRHGECECTLIQQYIAKQAYKAVDKLTKQAFSSENWGTDTTFTTTAPRPYDSDSSTSDRRGVVQGSSGLQNMAA
ncbi:hypothetical protein FOXG_22440 [Fusarium oxysporum f. sp. lycopersici 4287]|uniref:BZIP domain-containing protein n=1 Tax=Fusarium oxysporum f. sp. lycopersici (strain 4287 / CBS 123668 / FGSC 9935 / NRRL 34936) TaxID=426428 RepID=A0A0J9WLT3_FUSO4|nr:hypothetical protein FOXG_19267 [Fusarium oxysporum f. sp. lycopersici 4287]XP_018244725.1 hypothetical protein FOXG_19754 [Fusarium oxysporum f. sp. lycopersici 4287]XP_018257025.1 uncharacterized protein FOXG_22440 [Fusarium oxysporum f. sp. lycopersici 4287]KAJ9419185.1 hypothetical protein QL093DRAFT_2355708 [Fusarium oxysporum]KNB04332.1 hypothetical protein FOXG_19267 [Fusarium oxysporum f. sp. lycopersici 4287]KNB06680.1 hypothetical protein FOXG_19754 [Fusarium oxysporum f. sp. lyco